LLWEDEAIFMAMRIEDYALIGDCQTAALVARDGSIDWLCFPWFDSGACFAALLGSPKNGRWLIAPVGGEHAAKRRYREGTLILETDFETPDGAVTLIDCMPPRGEEPDVIRMVVGRRGRVRMRMELIIRFDYGSIVPWVQRTEGGIQAVAGPATLLLHTPVQMHGENLTTVAEFDVAAGEEIPFVLTWFPSYRPAPELVQAKEAIEHTEAWWKEWSSQCSYDGPWSEAVLRSLITLKALTFAPTGGIVAAPTTSLPEWMGSVRNWDYRYCWLRDATFTLYSLLVAGYTAEAKAWHDWLLRAVAGDPAGLQIMYSISGERRLPELELDWLEGYAGSRPVRVGNAASRQFQLDVYGELFDVLYLCRRQGLHGSDGDWRFERAVIKFLLSAWREPDEGIWEVRGPRRHFTHSKVMAWVAFDRAVKEVERFGLDAPLDTLKATRDEIHREVCEKGFDTQRGTFVQYYGGKPLDASLLMIPLVGFLPASDPRVQGTVAAIERELMKDGYVERYTNRADVDGLPPGEGSFLPCSFWFVDNLALQGRHAEAVAMYERLLAVRNDVGLLSEEYDPHAKQMLGNFPQAFSHVGLVNTARNLAAHQGPAEHRQNGGSKG
jgi:GH15 family glucan-1,4-alpha-glucosidase